jgi:hypothetical protein
MQKTKNSKNKYLFIASTMAVMFLFTKSGHTADISSLTSTFSDLLEDIGGLVKTVIRFAMWIALITVVYRYIKNKSEWEEMGRWTIGAIIIGLSNEVLSAIIGY